MGLVVSRHIGSWSLPLVSLISQSAVLHGPQRKTRRSSETCKEKQTLWFEQDPSMKNINKLPAMAASSAPLCVCVMYKEHGLIKNASYDASYNRWHILHQPGRGVCALLICRRYLLCRLLEPPLSGRWILAVVLWTSCKEKQTKISANVNSECNVIPSR